MFDLSFKNISLILSIIFFIGSFGSHVIVSSEEYNKPRYCYNPILSFLPWIIGLILPSIPLKLLLNYHWIITIIVNIVTAYTLGPFLTRGLLARMGSEFGFGVNVMYFFITGLLFMIIGILI
jgi:hypothetical protein